jgi:hypothetical protein
MNSYHYGRKEFHLSHEENTAAIVTFIGLIAGSLVLYILNKRFYVRPQQLVEISIDVACLALGIYITYRYFRHFKKRRLEAWPHPARPHPTAQRSPIYADSLCPEFGDRRV